MQQIFFALSREGQYIYEDIAYCKYLGLALSFAKAKSSMLGSELTKGIALQNFKATYFSWVTQIFEGKKGSKDINQVALMHQQVEWWGVQI